MCLILYTKHFVLYFIYGTIAVAYPITNTLLSKKNGANYKAHQGNSSALITVIRIMVITVVFQPSLNKYFALSPKPTGTERIEVGNRYDRLIPIVAA